MRLTFHTWTKWREYVDDVSINFNDGEMLEFEVQLPRIVAFKNEQVVRRIYSFDRLDSELEFNCWDGKYYKIRSHASFS